MNRSPLAGRLTSRPVLISPAGLDGLLASGATAGAEPRGLVTRMLGAVGRKPAAAKPQLRAPDALDGRGVERRDGYLLCDGVAVIRVEGVLWDEGYCYDDGWFSFSLYGYDDLRRAVAAASADNSVRGIWLRINSPGGLVNGLFETCAALAAVDKPMTAFIAGDGCSAAYALGCSAPRIVCAPAAQAGSIGVVWVHVDTSKMDERWGLTYTPIQFGAAKTDGAPFKPLEDSARQHFQGQIDTLGLRFAEHVAECRGLTVEAVIATEARVEMDDSALALGLVDEVAAEAAAFADFVATVSAGAPASPPASPASAQHAANQEGTMGLKQQIEAALARKTKGKASAEDTLKQIAAITARAEDGEDGGDEADEEEASTDEDETEASEEDDDTAAEGEEDETAAEAEEDEPAARKAKKAGAPKAGSAAYVLAIMDLPEAKGREAQARKVAAAGKFTVAEAKAFLKDLPKATGFAPLNPNVTAGGGKTSADADSRLLAAGAALAKRGR